MRNKRGRLILMGLLSLLVVGGTIGGALAEEMRPYKAPELRLEQGADEYDLMEGITYRSDHYELDLVDTGDFDIDIPGRYEVEYSLTPIFDDEPDEEKPEGGGGGSPSPDKATPPEAENDEDIGQNDNTGESQEDGGNEDTGGSREEDGTGDTDTGGNREEDETVDAGGSQEEDGTGDTETGGNREEDENVDAGGSQEEGGTGDTDTGGNQEEDGTGDADTGGNQEEDGTGDTGTGGSQEEDGTGDTDTGENQEEDGTGDTGTGGNQEEGENGDNGGSQDNSGTHSESSGQNSSSQETSDDVMPAIAQAISKVTGTVYAEEVPLKKPGTYGRGSLDTGDGVIYFKRTVRVIPGELCIKYENEELRIPTDAELYSLVSKEETAATPSVATAYNADEIKDENSHGETDKQRKNRKYELVLKGEDLLTEDAYVTDIKGERQPDIEVLIKDDTGLQAAVKIQENEDGKAEVFLLPGTYPVRLTATNPETGNPVTDVRYVTIEAGEQILFDAPTLFVGTRNTGFDLLSGVRAVSEDGQTVPVKVKDDSELDAARVTVTDEETGQENAKLKQGVYSVVLAAEHPVSKEEFTCKRRVEIKDGYYIYAPDLEVRANTTDYDPLEGVVVRDEKDEPIGHAEVRIKDMSALYSTGNLQNALPDDVPQPATMSDAVPEQPAGMRSRRAVAVTEAAYPPLREAHSYQIILASEDEGGNEITTVRNIRATEAATHIISYLINTTAPVEYGNAVDLDPKPSGGKTAGQVINELTGNAYYNRLYNAQIEMGKNDTLGGTGVAGNVLEVVRPRMNGSKLSSFMIVINNKTLSLTEDIEFRSELATTLRNGTIVTDGNRLSLGVKSAGTSLSLISINFKLPPGTTDFLELSNRLLFDEVKLPPEIVSRQRPDTSDVYINTRNGVQFGGALTGSGLALNVDTNTRGNLVGYNRGLHAPTGIEGASINMQNNSELWTSRMMLSGSLSFEKDNSQLKLVSWTEEGKPLVSSVRDLEVAGLNNMLYLYNHQNRDVDSDNPMLIIDNDMTTKNGPLILEDLDQNGSGSSSVQRFEELQKNKDATSRPFKAGDVIIKFKNPANADATHFESRIDNAVQGPGTKMFNLKANRQTGEIILTDEKPIRVTNEADSTVNDFSTHKEAIDFIMLLSGSPDITVKLMTDYALTKADRDAWAELNGYQGIITLTSDTALDGTPRRLRIRNGSPAMNLPVMAEGVVFKDIAFWIDGAKDFYANGTPVTFGENVIFVDNNPFTGVFGGSNLTDLSGDASITIRSGVFENVYGGGRDKKVANASVNVTGGTVKSLYGGMKGDNGKPTGKAELTVGNAVSELAIDNIYNFDQVNIAQDAEVTVSGKLNYRQSDTLDYQGKLVLGAGSTLRFLEADNRVGTLGITAGTAELLLKRTGSGIVTTPLVLDDANVPLDVRHGAAIRLGYSGTEPAQINDILLRFTQKDRATTEGIEAGSTIQGGLMADTDDGTVGLGYPVSLSVNGGQHTYYESVADALGTVSTGNSYELAVRKEGYRLTAKELEAIKNSGSTATKITFTSTFELSASDPILPGETVGQTVRRNVWLGEDLECGANTELTKIKLTFTSAADILAGGYDLTIGPETEIVPFNGRYPDLYGGGKSSIVGDTSLKVMSGTFGSVYGGGSQTTASIDGSTNVIIPATGTSDMAKIRNLLTPGGKGNVTGTASLVVRGGFFGTEAAGGHGGTMEIYGGMAGTTVKKVKIEMSGAGSWGPIRIYGAGNALVNSCEIDVKDAPVGSMKEVKKLDVYGGGAGSGSVDGNVSIAIDLSTTLLEDSDRIGIVSGYGVESTATGVLKDDVSGTRTMTLTKPDPSSATSVAINTVKGFTELMLGSSTDTSHLMLTVENLDSDPFAGSNRRTGILNMVNAKLELTGTDAGKIGVLKSGGNLESHIHINKADGGPTIPLQIDEGAEITGPKVDLSPSGGKTASEGDIILEFAEASKADPLKYQNLRSNYNITKKIENGKGYIYLAKPATHTTLVRVEYPDGLDTADASENRKNLVFRYDGNEAVKGGYVIGMPRSAAEDFDQSLAYTKHASTWDGTKDTIPTDAMEIVFTSAPSTTAADGRLDGLVVAPDTLYFAHIMDEMGNVATVILDTLAPSQSGTDVTVVYEPVTGDYSFSVTVKDMTVGWMPPDPLDQTSHLSYTPHGVKQWAWAVGPAAGNITAEAAAKEELMVAAPEQNGIQETAIPNPPLIDGAEGNYTFRVSGTALTKDSVVWVYAKDNLNNTVKIAIPVGDKMIDVDVPMKVKMVALKAAPGDPLPAPKLLAPVCYIANRGESRVKVEITSFEDTTPPSGKEITLVNRQEGISGNNLGLFIGPLAPNDPDYIGSFAARNVLDDITPATPLDMGIMEPATSRPHGLNFTFYAVYDAEDIQPTSASGMTGRLSYRFTVVPAAVP